MSLPKIVMTRSCKVCSSGSKDAKFSSRTLVVDKMAERLRRWPAICTTGRVGKLLGSARVSSNLTLVEIFRRAKFQPTFVGKNTFCLTEQTH